MRSLLLNDYILDEPINGMVKDATHSWWRERNYLLVGHITHEYSTRTRARGSHKSLQSTATIQNLQAVLQNFAVVRVPGPTVLSNPWNRHSVTTPRKESRHVTGAKLMINPTPPSICTTSPQSMGISLRGYDGSVSVNISEIGITIHSSFFPSLPASTP